KATDHLCRQHGIKSGGKMMAGDTDDVDEAQPHAGTDSASKPVDAAHDAPAGPASCRPKDVGEETATAATESAVATAVADPTTLMPDLASTSSSAGDSSLRLPLRVESPAPESPHGEPATKVDTDDVPAAAPAAGPTASSMKPATEANSEAVEAFGPAISAPSQLVAAQSLTQELYSSSPGLSIKTDLMHAARNPSVSSITTDIRPQTPPRTSSWLSKSKQLKGAHTSSHSPSAEPAAQRALPRSSTQSDVGSALWSKAASFASSFADATSSAATTTRRLSETGNAIAAAISALGIDSFSERSLSRPSSRSDLRAATEADGIPPLAPSASSAKESEGRLSDPNFEDEAATAAAFARRLRRTSSANLKGAQRLSIDAADETLVEIKGDYIVRTTDLANMLTAAADLESLSEEHRKRNQEWHVLFPTVASDQILIDGDLEFRLVLFLNSSQ
ncbi:hypothetical protein HK405_007264, partial [Cladochytrium tenue]